MSVPVLFLLCAGHNLVEVYLLDSQVQRILLGWCFHILFVRVIVFVLTILNYCDFFGGEIVEGVDLLVDLRFQGGSISRGINVFF